MLFKSRTFNNLDAKNLEQQGIHHVLSKIYAARGIKQVVELGTEFKDLLHPNLLTQCNETASYLIHQIQSKKNILIVADYDCDGATACAVGIRGLNMLFPEAKSQFHFLVPDRFTLGYGLTPEVVDLAMTQNPKPNILITVDNGIASLAGVDRANELDLDVIVTDHHLPADELPRARFIVNPNQPGCTFPSKSLAGVGVIFYLLLAIRTALRSQGTFDVTSQPKLENLLDLVALGTVADVASLDQNNRILVTHGLRRIKANLAQPGIYALLEIAKRNIQQVSSYDLGFTLGPRINAAGRLADMSIGIRCLLSDNTQEAQHLASELDRINRERRNIEAMMQESALEAIEDVVTTDTRSICLQDPSWHQGVIGILASRLKDKYYRPTIIFAPGTESNMDILKGSGRSITGFHLRDAIDLVAKRRPELILKFGGHAMAAGLSIPRDYFEEFKTAFEQVCLEFLDESVLAKCLYHDGFLNYEDIDFQLCETIDQAIWGQGFPAPVFLGEFEVHTQQVLQNKHLKLELSPITTTATSPTPVIKAIWFSRTATVPSQAKLAYRLIPDTYAGKQNVQLLIEGIDETL